MPLPKPRSDENRDDFINRCMGDDVMNEDYPDQDQRMAVCSTQWRKRVRDEATSADFTKVTEDGEFKGYASIFGEPAADGVVIAPGAFSKSIEEKGVSGVKMLWGHDTNSPIGVWEEVREDEKGLFVKGRLVLEVDKAKEVKALMQQGAVNGLSIMGDIVQEETIEGGGRLLTEIDLWEVSVVTFPANKMAKIDGDRRMTQINDAVILDAPRLTEDGYLVVDAKVARTGIQEYRGFEVGRPDMDVVKVYRPENEVFKRDAMHSFAHRPVTLDHPSEMVTADNWKQHAVGVTGDEVVRDGEFIRVPMTLMDAAAIKSVSEGKKQLSMGYTCDLKFEAGKTPSGEKYDAVQTDIKGNHLAVVAAARGGPALVIGDKKEPVMNLTTVIVDGMEVQVADVSQSVLKRALASLENQITKLKEKVAEEEDKRGKSDAALDEAKSEHEKAIAAKDAEIATVKKQLEDAEAKCSPEAMDAAVKDRENLIAKAKAMLGDKLVVDGRSDADIRKQVVTAHLGDASKEYSDEQIKVSFDTLARSAKAEDGTKRLAEHISNSGQSMSQQDKANEAYTGYVSDMQNAWRGAPATQQ